MMVHDPQWDAIDSWWEIVSRDREQDLVELLDVLERSHAAWATSPCLFDRDPLGADWGPDGPRVGPLRVNQEENWSQWLAHLLQSAPAQFTWDLLGVDLPDSPRRVRCEVPLSSDANHDRRADIVVECPDRGVSIEVKIDDDQYAKAPQTAYLVEQLDRELDWTHLLLLPKYNHARLRASVVDQFVESDRHRPRLLGARPTEVDVDVVYWRDVSRALRRTLRTDSRAEPHWQAGAYLLITLIERRLCWFSSDAAVRARTRSEATLGVTDVDHLQPSHLDEQREYLEDFLTHAND